MIRDDNVLVRLTFLRSSTHCAVLNTKDRVLLEILPFMPNGIAARVSRSCWTLGHFKKSAALAPIICSAVRCPMAEEDVGGVLLGLVVIILACVSILAVSHVLKCAVAAHVAAGAIVPSLSNHQTCEQSPEP